MRLLFLNPNTSLATSAWVREAVAAGLRPGESAHVETAATGPVYLSTPEDLRTGAASAAESAARCLPGSPAFDALVLACFADLAPQALSARVGLPVVSLLGASIELAGRLGRRWSVVTAGSGWRETLPGMVSASPQFRGQGALVSVRTFEPAAPRSPATEPALRAEIQRLAALCRHEDGADAVILGGAGWAGLAPDDLLVIDSVAAGLAVGREWAAAAHTRSDNPRP